MMRKVLFAAAAGGFVAPLVFGRKGLLGWPVGHACLLVPTLWRNSPWFGPIIREFPTARREVWLTIDDGPDPHDTPQILDALARHEARATFFVIGRKVDAHRDLVWRSFREGHQIGNHTYSHPSASFWALGPCATHREIRLGGEAIVTATGHPPALFRSPVGMTNPFVHSALGDQHLVGWTVSGLDGCSARGEVVVERLMRGVRPGAILVVHEGDGRAATVERLLERLTDEGYRCVIPAPGRLG